jgi:hypothetical protein
MNILSLVKPNNLCERNGQEETQLTKDRDNSNITLLPPIVQWIQINKDNLSGSGMTTNSVDAMGHCLKSMTRVCLLRHLSEDTLTKYVHRSVSFDLDQVDEIQGMQVNEYILMKGKNLQLNYATETVTVTLKIVWLQGKTIAARVLETNDVAVICNFLPGVSIKEMDDTTILHLAGLPQQEFKVDDSEYTSGERVLTDTSSQLPYLGSVTSSVQNLLAGTRQNLKVLATLHWEHKRRNQKRMIKRTR